MNEKLSALESLLLRLPEPEQTELLKRVRKLDITDDDDPQLVILEILGIWSAFFEKIPHEVNASLETIRLLSQGVVSQSEWGRIQSQTERMENLLERTSEINKQLLSHKYKQLMPYALVLLFGLFAGLILRDIFEQDNIAVFVLVGTSFIGACFAWIFDRAFFTEGNRRLRMSWQALRSKKPGVENEAQELDDSK